MNKAPASILVLSAILISALLAQPVTAQVIDLKTLNACSDRAWEADVAAWSHYAFERSVIRRSLDGDGNVDSREQLRFRITPKGDGFDEELLQLCPRITRQVEEVYRRRYGLVPVRASIHAWASA